MRELIDLSEKVIRIKLENGGAATAFLVNYEMRNYWVTAKHVLFGKERSCAEIFHEGEWRPFAIITQKYHEIFDIMTFTTGDDFPIEVESGLKIVIPNYDNYGDEVFCLGFPYNASFDISISGKEIPLIKKGIISSVNGNNCYLIDKMTAAGFSGSPIIMNDAGEYKVVGIVSNGSYQHIAREKTDKTIEMALDCPYRTLDEFTLCVNIYNVISLCSDSKL